MKRELDLFDRIRFAREGAAVERCHVHPHSQPYTVGQHTHDLVSLIILCWQAAHGGELPRAELIVAAQFHDSLGERVFGDMPQPVKALLGEKVEALEKNLEQAVGVRMDPRLTEEEALWLRIADKVELYLWCCEEAGARGRPYFYQWVEDYDKYFRDNQPPFPFSYVMAMARAAKGRRLSFDFLKELAGL